MQREETLTDDRADADLLAASARGDSSAFEAFADRHEAWLYRFARALSATDAEEVLQDALIDAWRGARSFSGSATAKGWLVTIARNAYRRRFRLRAGEPAAHDSDASMDALAVEAGWGSEAPDRVLERIETKALVDQALARLVIEEREAVVLRDIEGFSGEEAARLLGVTLAAFKSRLHRGRLHVAAHLRRHLHAQP